MSSPFDEFGSTEAGLWNSTFGEGFSDSYAESLFDAAYFHMGGYDTDQLNAIREHLNEYLMEEYDFDFDEAFDWEAWREAYE